MTDCLHNADFGEETCNLVITSKKMLPADPKLDF